MVCQFSHAAFQGAYYSYQCKKQVVEDIVTGVATLSFCEEHCKTVSGLLALVGIDFIDFTVRRHIDGSHT